MNKEVKKLMAINKMLGRFGGEDFICLAVGIDELVCGGVCRTCKWNSENYDTREDK
jgi:hypothetical protein